MIASRKFLLLASLLFAAPAFADDLPACNPATAHEEANDLQGQWRLIVVPQVIPAGQPQNQCNQLTLTFANGQFDTKPATIKAYSFASSCHEGDASKGAGIAGKVTATYCYIQATSKELRRVHQILLYNQGQEPYVASYSLWDSGKVDNHAILKGIGNDAAGGGVNAWLISENP